VLKEFLLVVNLNTDQIIEICKILGAAVGGVTVFLIGRVEYRKSVKIKRAEFLDKLIEEFLDDNTAIARSMLDGYVYVTEEMKEMSPMEQKENAVSLKKYLRNHEDEPIANVSEIKVRKSFDSLFDFFTKLSYYLSNDLISPSELTYFRYYLNKLDERKDEVDVYIKKYFYVQDIAIVMDALKKLNSKDSFR
jgi:hypothetical protein